MLVSWLVLFLIHFVSASVLNDDIHIDLCNGINEADYKDNIRRALMDVEEKINQIDTISSVSKIGELIPGSVIVTGPFNTFIQRQMNEMRVNELSNIITDTVDRRLANQETINMLASLTTITQQFEQIRNSVNLPEADIRIKLHIVQNEIMKSINLYKQEGSIFCKYPELAIVPFGAIAILLNVFEPLRKKILPAIKTTPDLACQLQNLCDKYAFLYVFNRFYEIQVLGPKDGSSIMHPGATTGYSPNWQSRNEAAIDIFLDEYNQHGYNTTERLLCDEPGYKNSYLLDKTGYNSKLRFHMSDRYCSKGYLQLVRHKIESAFDDSKKTLNDICTNDYRSTFRKKTNRGYLTIIFGRAWGDQDNCEWHSPCDLYIDLHVNGNKVLTTWVIESNSAYYFKKYESGNIAETSEIEMRLMDKDVGDDEVLVRTKHNLRYFIDDYGVRSHKFTNKNNGFEVKMFWMPIYERDSRR